MKIVTLADTHGLHNQIVIPDGDIIIHAGDITAFGSMEDVIAFGKWFSLLPHGTKIVIAGNHDDVCQRQPEEVKTFFKSKDIIYLCDRSIMVDGIKFYGSPWTPSFGNWSFMKNRGEMMAKKWQKIPKDTDILITHGPPAGVLDVVRGSPCGCADLLLRVEKVRPKYHIFGHIHEYCGQSIRFKESPKLGETNFVNCSVVDEMYRIVCLPITIEI